MYNSCAGRPLIIVVLVGTDIIQIKSFPHYLHFFNTLMYAALMDCPLLSFSHKMLGTICPSAELKNYWHSLAVFLVLSLLRFETGTPQLEERLDSLEG